MATRSPPTWRAGLEAGCRRFVIATTGWAQTGLASRRCSTSHGAAAVAASNFSLGVVLFGRLVEAAVELFGPLEAFDPYLVEWHRRSKRDRPSGTATDLARRIVADHPRLATADDLEVVSVRAGASPGMHLVGFDAAGETIELRLTARDRSPTPPASSPPPTGWNARRARPASTPSTPSSTSSSLATRSLPERTLR